MTSEPQPTEPPPTEPQTAADPGENPDTVTKPKPGVNDPHPDEADTDEPLTSM
ncbi:hypothetical protein [Aeromicrobium sp.]|uniref:hypothetical protein n=1 Tax=Aeromicrobium sp. TaxID=1871063 RepID=UPI0019998E46|nr:hypothetical protein [Aeromicrobium sp.]MBC7631960.1 hypothetical protein [Aeromicrobium sp.]